MPGAPGYRASSSARVIGQTGEWVEVQYGQVRPDGQPFDEPHLQGLGLLASDLPPTSVPPVMFFCSGRIGL